MFDDRVPMVLTGAALKEAVLPPGTLLHLAERFLPAFSHYMASPVHRLIQSTYLLVRPSLMLCICFLSCIAVLCLGERTRVSGSAPNATLCLPELARLTQLHLCTVSPAALPGAHREGGASGHAGAPLLGRWRAGASCRDRCNDGCTLIVRTHHGQPSILGLTLASLLRMPAQGSPACQAWTQGGQRRPCWWLCATPAT